MSVVVPNLDDGKFHDIVASWDSDSNLREIYIDGIRYASLTASGYNAQQINFCVGKTNVNEYFSGYIEYVKIYDRQIVASGTFFI